MYPFILKADIHFSKSTFIAVEPLFEGVKNNTISSTSYFNKASYYINKQYQENFEEKLSFWKNKIEPLSPLDLYINNHETSNKGQQVFHIFNKEMREKLSVVSKNINSSEYSILYTLFTLLLYKLSNQKNSLLLQILMNAYMFLNIKIL